MPELKLGVEIPGDSGLESNISKDGLSSLVKRKVVHNFDGTRKNVALIAHLQLSA